MTDIKNLQRGLRSNIFIRWCCVRLTGSPKIKGTEKFGFFYFDVMTDIFVCLTVCFLTA
jgi:hypothetical protein